MKEKSRLAIFGGVAALVAGVLVFAQLSQPASAIPYKDAEAVALGEKIYQGQCASCHGTDLRGEPDWQQRDDQGYLPAPPHDQSGHTWHHDDQLLFKMTKEGIQAIAGPDYRSRMPAFKESLSDEEIWAVLAYIKAQWPDEITERHTAMFSQ